MNDQTAATGDPVDEALELFDEIDTGDPAEADEDLDADEDPRAAKATDDDEEEGEDDADDASSDADEPVKGKRSSRFQKRIDQLTREKNDAARELEYERSRVQQMEAYVRSLEPTQQQVDYGHRQGYSPDQVRGMVQDEARSLIEQERFASTVDGLRARLNEAAPDALARLSNPALTVFEPEAVEALAETQNSVQIAKAIAGNEELFAKFASLKNGTQRAAFIARLDGRIEGRKSARAKTGQTAATPKVRGTTRAPEKDPEKMDQAEYEAWRRKQGWG